MFDIEKTLKNLINFGINSVTSGSNSLDTVLNKNTIQDLENEINKSEFENFNSLDEDDLL
jgi:Trp operon repressor